MKYVKVAIIAGIIQLILVTGIMIFQSNILAPKLYDIGQWDLYSMLICVACCYWLPLCFFLGLMVGKSFKTVRRVINYLLYIIMTATILITMFNVTYITKQDIRVFSIINWKGDTYKYSDVKKIEIKYTEQGSFDYILHLDNKDINIWSPDSMASTDSEYVGYCNLLELDKQLVSMGIEKSIDEVYKYKYDEGQKIRNVTELIYMNMPQ